MPGNLACHAGRDTDFAVRQAWMWIPLLITVLDIASWPSDIQPPFLPHTTLILLKMQTCRAENTPPPRLLCSSGWQKSANFWKSFCFPDTGSHSCFSLCPLLLAWNMRWEGWRCGRHSVIMSGQIRDLRVEGDGSRGMKRLPGWHHWAAMPALDCLPPDFLCETNP